MKTMVNHTMVKLGMVDSFSLFKRKGEPNETSKEHSHP